MRSGGQQGDDCFARPTACPNCGSDSGGVLGTGTPKPEDVTVCRICGYLMAFAEDLTLRELTAEEQRLAALDPRVRELQREARPRFQ